MASPARAPGARSAAAAPAPRWAPSPTARGAATSAPPTRSATRERLHLPDRNLRRGLLCHGYGLHRRNLHISRRAGRCLRRRPKRRLPDRPDLLQRLLPQPPDQPGLLRHLHHRLRRPGTGTCQGARTCTAGVCGFAPAAANTVCRASTGPCDPAEVCDGTLLACPANALTPTGQPGTCPSGQVCCGGACTQVGTVTNCETCGDICLANEVCTSVAAGCTCPNAVCGGACCAANQVCIGGVCSPRSPDGGVCDAAGAGDCQAGPDLLRRLLPQPPDQPGFLRHLHHRLRRPGGRHLPGRPDLHRGGLRLRPAARARSAAPRPGRATSARSATARP